SQKLLKRFFKKFLKMDISRKENYKYDFQNFFHNVDSDLHKAIPLLIKFPKNEFCGEVCNTKVTLFDLIHTINDFVGGKLEIKSKHGSSLYKLIHEGSYDTDLDEHDVDIQAEERIKKQLRGLGYL
ncbi:hypothetical protein ACFLRF_06595, partial [Candidatus Altiarchaeota archaeon]